MNIAIWNVIEGSGSGAAPPSSDWILATNFWNDSGVWKDGSTWND